MKKIIALVLSLALVFSLCACGKKAETPAPAPAETPAPAAPTAAPETPAPTEAPAEHDERFVGPWKLAGALNEYAAILEYFGTSVGEYGAAMELKSSGEFDY